MFRYLSLFFFFFFNDTATTEIYTLSLHDALPIYSLRNGFRLTAGEHLVRAAIYYHFAKFVFVQDPAQMRAAHMKAVECYRSEEHTSELQSRSDLVCRLLLEKKKRQSSTSQLSRHD